ncbi:hypothetical protein Y032_0149g2700 [Ancylostoma ceylanicum]|uniref:Uncharacterized protein n=1 Tax=Ancylostoma ceylanicum TaxID=53326 RepID=A0A016T1R6_9BILA|nr:hypothetical protein Y032_0149g2700 [Ancylostoma ceylanicum]
MDGLVGHGRDRIIDRVRAQRASYHCATCARPIMMTMNNKRNGNEKLRLLHAPSHGQFSPNLPSRIFFYWKTERSQGFNLKTRVEILQNGYAASSIRRVTGQLRSSKPKDWFSHPSNFGTASFCALINPDLRWILLKHLTIGLKNTRLLFILLKSVVKNCFYGCVAQELRAEPVHLSATKI